MLRPIEMRLSEGVHAFRGYFMTALLRVFTRRIHRNSRLTREHSGLTHSRLMQHQSHPRERSCFLMISIVVVATILIAMMWGVIVVSIAGARAGAMERTRGEAQNLA